MKRFLLCFLVISVFIISTSSCKKKSKEQLVHEPVFSTHLPNSLADTSSIKEIYYGLMTPVEVCNIFEKLNLSYNDTIVNSYENADLYMTSYKAAMNLGVYGVDMGYMKLFGVNRQTINYYMTISTLSERLNIPEDLLTDGIRGIDRSMTNADSLTKLMTRTYKKIDDHLRSENGEAALGMMMMAGWIESMYLATQLAYDSSNPDPLIVEKIAQQKYSLMSLLSYMKNYYDDPMIVYYTKKLKYLNRWFDTFNIYYKKGDVSVDTTKQVIKTTGTEMNVTIGTINQIRDYIAHLRREIVMV